MKIFISSKLQTSLDKYEKLWRLVEQKHQLVKVELTLGG